MCESRANRQNCERENEPSILGLGKRPPIAALHNRDKLVVGVVTHLATNCYQALNTKINLVAIFGELHGKAGCSVNTVHAASRISEVRVDRTSVAISLIEMLENLQFILKL